MKKNVWRLLGEIILICSLKIIQKIILCKLRYNEDFVWRYFIRDIEI